MNKIAAWRNGRRGSLKNSWGKPRVGSTPTVATERKQMDNTIIKKFLNDSLAIAKPVQPHLFSCDCSYCTMASHDISSKLKTSREFCNVIVKIDDSDKVFEVYPGDIIKLGDSKIEVLYLQSGYYKATVFVGSQRFTNSSKTPEITIPLMRSLLGQCLHCNVLYLKSSKHQAYCNYCGEIGAAFSGLESRTAFVYGRHIYSVSKPMVEISRDNLRPNESSHWPYMLITLTGVILGCSDAINKGRLSDFWMNKVKPEHAVIVSRDSLYQRTGEMNSRIKDAVRTYHNDNPNFSSIV